MGLIPGGERSRNNRAHSNFSTLPPFDNRHLAPGRLAGEYDVVMIFNPEKLIDHDLRLSMNAILVTDSNLPWTTVDLVYVVPPINSGKSWVLYSPDLIGRKIMGHTAPSHGKYMPVPVHPIRIFLKVRVTLTAGGVSVLVASRSTQRGSPLVSIARSSYPSNQLRR